MQSFIDKAGGKRFALHFGTHSLLGRIGLYRRFRRIEWTEVDRLVFVCSGNICRSPYAAELARSKGFEVASFGVRTQTGAPADPVAVRVAAKRGVDLRGHQSTCQQEFMPRRGDLLIGMEPLHLRPIGHFAAGGAQLTLAGLWTRVCAPYLPDPYGLGEHCFDFVFELIEESIANIGDRIHAVHGKSRQ
jgi:protein-tyrosine phosphatase